MSDKIKVLPDYVANQIAAGEVVNNPASAVKELMENAVDAGSTSITVNFRDGGKELIQIVDNGCGMSASDARLAFDRHATSKIDRAEDIYALHTFGFRGEALASIAAVGEVELRTRQVDDACGTLVEISGGTFRDQSSINCPLGTQIMVKNLFYNIPARRRFMEKSTTESRRIREDFRRVVLCNPSITFSLYDNDALLYKLDPSSLKQRIINVIGKGIAANLLDVKADTSLVRIEGFVGLPSASKQHNGEQYMFVNGRYFRSLYLQKAIFKAYEKLIPANTKPSYFLYLDIDPDRIDVNVHPQKTEIKFEDASAVWQIIHAAVRESLAKLGALPMMDFDKDTSIEIPVYRAGTTYRNPDIISNPDFNPFREERYSMMQDSASYSYSTFDSSDDSFVDYASSIDRHAQESTIEFIDQEQIMQNKLHIEDKETILGNIIPLGDKYCAAFVNGDLMILDLQRAHEVVLYNRYLKILKGNTSVCQQLLFPQQVDLAMEDCLILNDTKDDLFILGFDVEIVGDNMVMAKGLPSELCGLSSQKLIGDIVSRLRDEVDESTDLRGQRIAASMAHSGAYGLNILKYEEIKDLLQSLLECKNNGYTPDGKQVAITISKEEIVKRIG